MRRKCTCSISRKDSFSFKETKALCRNLDCSRNNSRWYTLFFTRVFALLTHCQSIQDDITVGPCHSTTHVYAGLLLVRAWEHKCFVMATILAWKMPYASRTTLICCCSLCTYCTLFLSLLDCIFQWSDAKKCDGWRLYRSLADKACVSILQ